MTLVKMPVLITRNFMPIVITNSQCSLGLGEITVA
jgi:hypothetical protein